MAVSLLKVVSELKSGRLKMCMAGLGLFDQKSALAVTTPIVTAFKFCIGHRKNGLLNRKPTEVKFWCF
jgi:hypothetical protein